MAGKSGPWGRGIGNLQREKLESSTKKKANEDRDHLSGCSTRLQVRKHIRAIARNKYVKQWRKSMLLGSLAGIHSTKKWSASIQKLVDGIRKWRIQFKGRARQSQEEGGLEGVYRKG
jgi:hypothetical protein